MATIKFWQGMQRVVTIDGQDKLMIGKNSTGEAQYVNVEDLSQFLSIQGDSMPAIQGGSTAVSAVALPTLGNENRYFDASWGYWKYNNVVLTNPNGVQGIPDGSEGVLFWNGTDQTWTISKVQALPTIPLASEVIEGGVKAVTQDAVFKAIDPLDESINSINTIVGDYFDPITTIVIGGDAIINQSSTFAGWGQSIGVRKNFNAVKYTVFAFNSSNLPTYVELRIRRTDKDGEVLYLVRYNYTFEYQVKKDVIFLLPEEVLNTNNDELFAQINADGYISSIGSLTGSPTRSLKYTTAKGATTTPSSTTSTVTLGLTLMKGSYKTGFTELGAQQIKDIVIPDENTTPNMLLTSKVWLYPSLEYNIFNKNVLIPLLGYNISNYVIDYSSTVGRQFNRGYRLNPIGQSVNSNITINISKGKELIITKNQNILSTSASNGSGQIRKALFFSDSTINAGVTHSSLKTIFDSDVLGLSFIGTLGATGLKHEGRSGWGVNSWYGLGSSFYKVDVTGLTDVPTTGAVYLQSVQYRVVEVNVTGGNGYLSFEQISGAVRPLSATGSLTKVSGTGQSTITYTSTSVTGSNPAYNPAIGKFDIGYYLSNTGQTLSDNDWIFFQLGINDMFSVTDNFGALSRVEEIWGKLSYMLDNINAYNPNIRIGISLIFPAADQDGFGANYALKETSEIYNKVAIAEWQKRLIQELDNDTQRGLNRFLVSTHVNLDSEYSYPSSDNLPNARYTGTRRINMQTNALHPSNDGYSQIADMYAGIIKYFG